MTGCIAEGADWLLGGSGEDIDGGTGNDTYQFAIGDGRDEAIFVGADAPVGGRGTVALPNSIWQAYSSFFHIRTPK